VISADTSVLVRYLVGTPTGQARAAARLIDSDREIGVSPVALAECAHVLRTQYGVPREDIIETLISLVQRQNVNVLGMRTEAIVDALVRARSLPGRPIPDALIVAASVAAGALPLLTFDRQQRRYGIATEDR
jgi:predicted nucleic acid-binding protein